MKTLSEFCWNLRGLSLESYTSDEVLRIQWAAEALVRKAKDEQQRRDARMVDAACALKIGDAAA